MEVYQGQHWALLGPNGAGKTTVLGLCGAQTHPTSGAVWVLGERLGRVDMQALRRRIGHVNPRHALTSPLTVTEVVITGMTSTIELPMRFTPSVAQVERARQLVDQVGLSERADAAWTILSQGERGRTLIARALAGDPPLLLLDEPTTGLDVAAREQLLETIDTAALTDPGLTSVLVTHHLEELPETTTHALLMAHGRVVAHGPVDEVLTTERVSQAFAHPIEVERVGRRWAARAVRTPEVPGSSGAPHTPPSAHVSRT